MFESLIDFRRATLYARATNFSPIYAYFRCVELITGKKILKNGLNEPFCGCFSLKLAWAIFHIFFFFLSLTVDAQCVVKCLNYATSFIN